MKRPPEPAAEPLSVRWSAGSVPLGVQVRFIRSAAPTAHKRFGTRVGTVVTINHMDGELGLTFGWAAKREDGRGWRWSGDQAITWALPQELEVVS